MNYFITKYTDKVTVQVLSYWLGELWHIVGRVSKNTGKFTVI